MFYLEKIDEITGAGPYLKYGRVGKPITSAIDLIPNQNESHETWNGTHVIKEHGSRRKFKVITEEVSLSLKAETTEERESWITALVKET